MELKYKIAGTNLFSSLEKINLLVHLDEMDEKARKELETIIDDYEDSLKSLAERFQSDVNAELDKIEGQNEGAIAQGAKKLKEGLNSIFTTLGLRKDG